MFERITVLFASNSVPEFTPTDKREEKMMKKKENKKRKTYAESYKKNTTTGGEKSHFINEGRITGRKEKEEKITLCTSESLMKLFPDPVLNLW